MVCPNAITRTCGSIVLGLTCNTGNADGTVNTCSPGLACQPDGTCTPWVREGQACVADGMGARCLFPAYSLDGRCQLNARTDCPVSRPAAGYPLGADPWCPGTKFPLYCPEGGDQGWGCWQAGTVCETRVSCNGEGHACATPDQSYDCATKRCAPACTPPAATAPACDACVAKKCCATLSACKAAPGCSAKTGPAWDAVAACAQQFCAETCTGTTPTP